MRVTSVWVSLLWWVNCRTSLAIATDPSNSTSTSWRQVTRASPTVTPRPTSSPAVGGHMGARRVRSKVECALECQRYSHCSSLAFDPTSGFCYLQPDLSNDLGQVWAKTGPVCHLDPPISGGAVVDWDISLTTFRGQVTCNDDFMKTVDDVNVTCTAAGSWVQEGECQRHIWHYPQTFPVPIPRPVVLGWTLCVDGFPTSDTAAFRIDLLVDSQSMLHTLFIKADSEHGTNSIYIANQANGQWEYPKLVQVTPWPLSTGTLFQIKYKYTSSNTFEISMDGVLRETHSVNFPITDIVHVEISYAVNVTRLDTWCQT